MLFDPSVSIRFGSFYLSHLFSICSEEWQAIAAYNAGEGAVSEWILKGINAETIPFRETKAYLNKVNRAVARYRKKNILAFD